MGASQSSAAGDGAKHVFTSDTPINFSPELIDSLQASSETNSTRAKTLDLHIAQRVAAELEKLQAKESSALEAIRAKIAAGEDKVAEGAEKAKGKLPSISIPGVGGESKEEKERKSQTSAKVAEEIEKLKATLGQRKVLKTLPKEVEIARNSVVSCLRVNDRKPLDCWKEVELFKREVKKLEDEFVAKVL